MSKVLFKQNLSVKFRMTDKSIIYNFFKLNINQKIIIKKRIKSFDC